MPASEQKRLALRNRLIEVLGEEEAEVLMESLPPFDWHQLATKDDIKGTHKAIDALGENLRTEMDGRFAMVEAEFKMLRAENKEIRVRETRSSEVRWPSSSPNRPARWCSPCWVCRYRPGARSWPWAWADAAPPSWIGSSTAGPSRQRSGLSS